MRLVLLLPVMLVLAILATAWPFQEPTRVASVEGPGEVIGSGRISVDGESRSFSIDVRSMADGSVNGHATIDDHALDRDATRWAIDGVVVEDHVAYVCCIYDSADDLLGGTRWVIRAVDNRAGGAPLPDQLSLPRGPVVLSCAHPEFLEFRQAIDSAALHDVVAGDIEVRYLPMP